MKLTTSQLRKIIKEELNNVLVEGDLSGAGKKIDPTNPMFRHIARQKAKNTEYNGIRHDELPFPLLFLRDAFMELMYKPSKKLVNYLAGLVKSGKSEEEIKQVLDKHSGDMKEGMGEDKPPMPSEMEAAIMRDLQE